VTKLQEKGVISLSNANDVFSAMLEKVVIPKEEGSGQLQKQAATGSTSSKTQKPKKARKVKSTTAPKIKKSKQARGTKAKKQSQSPRKKGKKKLRVDRSDLDGPLEPARVNSLRTFDSIDSTVSDDLDLDMDPTDAFEFNLTSDEFQGEKWFGDDIGNSDMPMSVSYSA